MNFLDVRFQRTRRARYRIRREIALCGPVLVGLLGAIP
jgi:hypothetical protein